MYSSRVNTVNANNESHDAIQQGVIQLDINDDEKKPTSNDLQIKDELETELTKKNKANEDKIGFLNRHPEIFFDQLLKNLSWVMFLLIPFYGFILWLFFRKAQKYYITHLIMAVNQHAFIILFILFGLSVILPDFSDSFRNYILLLFISFYTIVGYKVLYQQSIRKILLKFFVIGTVYFTIVLAVSIGIIVLVAVQNGISLD